jgi:hypothetical protein
VDREKDGLRWNWAPAVENSAGKLCTKACEWYGGPFFEDDGKVFLNSYVDDKLMSSH